MKVAIGRMQTRAKRVAAKPLGVGLTYPSGDVTLTVALEDGRRVWLEFEQADPDVVDRLIERLMVLRASTRKTRP